MLILELQLELVESAEERRRGRGRDFQLRRPADEEGYLSELLRLEREWVSWKSLSSQAGGAYMIVPHRNDRKKETTLYDSVFRIPLCFLRPLCMQRERTWGGGEEKENSH
jgi:hypothetical protein